MIKEFFAAIFCLIWLVFIIINIIWNIIMYEVKSVYNKLTVKTPPNRWL